MTHQARSNIGMQGVVLVPRQNQEYFEPNSDIQASSHNRTASETRVENPPSRNDNLDPPPEKTFYGLINDCIEDVVCDGFGREQWHEIKRRAGCDDVEDGDFVISQKYSQEMTYKILDAITQVLGITTEQALEATGEGFIDSWCVKHHYIDLLRSQGKNMRELLANMDKMHAYLNRAKMPGMAPPCFKVEEAADGRGFFLNYWSFRPGLAPLARGIVRAVGRKLFGEEFRLETVASGEGDGSYWTKFHVTNEDERAAGGAAEHQGSATSSGGAPMKCPFSGVAISEEMPARNDGLEPPPEKTFYGLINDCIEDVVCDGFGREQWHEIKRRAGCDDVEDGDFVISQKYSQEMTYKILDAITQVLGITTEQALEATGEGFIDSWCVKHHYIDLLRSQGKNMRELLANMDKMHAYLNRAKMPGMAPPCFKVEEAADGRGFFLNYWSFRPGLAPLAKGIVRAAGRMLFGQDFDIETLKACEKDGQYYTLFRVSSQMDDVEYLLNMDGVPDPEGNASPALADGSAANVGVQQPVMIAKDVAVVHDSARPAAPRDDSERGGLQRRRRSSIAEMFAEHVVPWFKGSKPKDESPTAAGYRLRRNRSISSAGESESSGGGKGAASPTGRRTMAGGNEVGALVFMLKDSVSQLQSAKDVEQFHAGFTVDQLCPLLELKGADAVAALQALFREPIATSLRCPHSGYPPSAFAVYEYPSVTMHRAVTARLTHGAGKKAVDWMHSPLADQLPREGLLGVGAAKEMRQLEIRVCVLRNVVQLRVLRSIAHNHNPALFESRECQAIILAAWQKIRFRYLLDLLFEGFLLSVLSQWDRTQYRFTLGLPVIALTIVKEVLEELWGLWVHYQRGWLWSFCSTARLNSATRVVLLALFFSLNTMQEPLVKQRPVFAFLVLLRWGRLLYMFRAFDGFGPKLLPIIYMFRSMGPFFMVLGFFVAAFTHSLWALSDKSGGDILTICYRLGILMDFTLDSQFGEFALVEGDEMDGWQLAWFYACSVLLTLFMMNVVIGVLGESYDTEQDRAGYSFLASRAQICYEYIPRLKRSAKPLRLYEAIRWVNHKAQESQGAGLGYMLLCFPVWVLYAMQRSVVCEWRVFDNHGDASKDSVAPYLWFCTAKGGQHSQDSTRTARLKQHMEETGHELQGRMDSLEKKMDKAFEKVMKGMATLADKMSSLQPPEGVQAAAPQGRDFTVLQNTTPTTHQRPSAPPRPSPSNTTPPSVPPRNDGLPQPAEKTFYGLINDCIEDVVCDGFGREQWHEIKRRAGCDDVEDGDFVISQKYSQEMTYKILDAITQVLGITTEQALEATGEGFIDSWCVKYNYIDLLRSQGKNMRELLANMDKMHAYLNRAKMPGMAPPCFKVEEAADGRGFFLNYWSFRPGLAPLARGIVRAVGRKLFGEEFRLETVASGEGDGSYWTKFHVTNEDERAAGGAAEHQGSATSSGGAPMKCPFSGVAVSPDMWA